MGAHYQELDRAGGFDYALHRITSLADAQFRGPAVDLNHPFLAFVGAAQTFGRFVHAPFPALIGARLGLPALNLGVGGAGPRYFDTPPHVTLLNRAEAVVIQVLSGRSASNSQFDNSVGGGLKGRPRFGDAPVRAEAMFAKAAKDQGTEVVERLVQETREDYLRRFLALMDQITAPKILFWFSTRTPEYEEDYSSPPYGILGDFPQLVNRRMLAEMAAACDAQVECVSATGLPQPLWPAEKAIEGAAFDQGRLENRYYPSPQMHAQAADALEHVCRRFTGRPIRPHEPSFRRFVIVGAERTGTNLLISLLNQHAGCLCMNELYNPVSISGGLFPGDEIPEPERAKLAELRRTDPVGFWRDLTLLSRSRGHRAFGFKLFYTHALAQPELLDALADDRSVGLIHITRRNLLRRLVSEQQALAVQQWAVGWAAKLEPRPAVTIDAAQLLSSVTTMQARQAQFDERFAGHQVLRLLYEDLAARPQQVARRAANFLSLPALSEPATVLYQKTGSSELSQAIEGFDVLRAQAKRWGAMFDN